MPSSESARVIVRGDIDVSVISRVVALACAALEQSVVGIALDLSEVSFIDAAGIGGVVVVDNAARTAGKVLNVYVNPRVRRVLMLAHAGYLLDRTDPATSSFQKRGN